MTEPNTDNQEQFFDGVNISPQFAQALRHFIQSNPPGTKHISGITVIPGGSSHYAIAHGLGAAPLVIVSGYPNGFVNVGGSPPVSDATNIYIDTTGATACTVYWAAFIP